MKDAWQQTKPCVNRPSREAAARGSLEGGTTSNGAREPPSGGGRLKSHQSCKNQEVQAVEPQTTGTTGMLGCRALRDMETRRHCITTRSEPRLYSVGAPRTSCPPDPYIPALQGDWACENPLLWARRS